MVRLCLREKISRKSDKKSQEVSLYLNFTFELSTLISRAIKVLKKVLESEDVTGIITKNTLCVPMEVEGLFAFL